MALRDWRGVGGELISDGGVQKVREEMIYSRQPHQVWVWNHQPKTEGEARWWWWKLAPYADFKVSSHRGRRTLSINFTARENKGDNPYLASADSIATLPTLSPAVNKQISERSQACLAVCIGMVRAAILQRKQLCCFVALDHFGELEYLHFILNIYKVYKWIWESAFL